MTRVILQVGIIACLIALHSFSLTPSQHTEVVGAQFLLPEFLGCTSRHIQSEDASTRLRRLDATVETLRASYENKDVETLNALFTPLTDSARLLSAIHRDFEVYDSISLTFSIDRILITQRDYAVHLHWEGIWHAPNQDLPQRERGLSVFKFTGDQGITLRTIDGDSPFGIGVQSIHDTP